MTAAYVIGQPKGWQCVGEWGSGFAFRQKEGGLRVIVDCTEKDDGFEWLHVIVSRKNWAPSHQDMAIVKESFIGNDRYAYSVWPPAERYVNIHPFCLHLWARMDDHGNGAVLPEFSEELPLIGRSI